MQIISAAPLIDKFQNSTFKQSEVGPYFMAYMIYMAVGWIFAFGEPNLWDIAAALASVVITVFGLLHLKSKNLDTFDNNFVIKYFCLGWVITVRMLLLVIPAAVVIMALASIVGGDDALSPAGALLIIGFEIVFYWWLGLLFEQSNQPQSEQDAAIDRE
ncbi:hypothetical protein [Rubritalea sp.]|uniref:hypothetical protein n=1 Tax=Rubritalea sp. TaxID=2109375 RepID=UPI003242A4FB